MTRRDPPSTREEALARLLRDARAQQQAELDWSGIERRLMSEVARETRVSRRFPYPLAGALAAAAAALLFFVETRAKVAVPPPSPPVVEASEPTRESGDTMVLGSRVVALDHELSVHHAGRATWTLAPHSAAQLVQRDDRIRLHLEQGSVSSEVVPNPQPETFVVEALHTRVAVHGTVFSVTLQGQRVMVRVREGIVAVGPQGAAPSFFLKAPARGDFAADGRSGTIDDRPVKERAEHRPEPLKLIPLKTPSATPPPSPLLPAPSAELPLEPSISDIESGISQIVDATTDCFGRHTQSAEGVQITVRTALNLRVTDAGEVASAEFQPPLSPEAAECTAARIARITFARSQNGASVTRMLELKR